MKVYIVNAKKVLRLVIITILIVILASAAGIIGMKAVGVSSALKDLPIYSVQTDGKKAAITFDCAWGDGDIPQILEALKTENVRATFFIVGQWAEKHPQTVRLIAEGGQDVANHSYSHLRMGGMDNGKIKDEIAKCGSKLGEITGSKIDLFRAPYGDYSNNVINVARGMGYYTIQWDVDSLDWKPEISEAEILQRIMTKIQPGSILLFHNDTPHTARMMPVVISSLKKEGYELVSVSELILRSGFTIDHEGRQIGK